MYNILYKNKFQIEKILIFKKYIEYNDIRKLRGLGSKKKGESVKNHVLS
jgi:hypothetical protein